MDRDVPDKDILVDPIMRLYDPVLELEACVGWPPEAPGSSSTSYIRVRCIMKARENGRLAVEPGFAEANVHADALMHITPYSLAANLPRSRRSS